MKLLTLAALLLLLLASCGIPKQDELGVRDLDTSLYSKYIVKGPDTNLYPMYQWTTSQRFPLDKYGLHRMFDGDKKTWWCSQAGLNYGEGVELQFENLEAKSVKIVLANEMTVAKVTMVRVFVNDSLYGNFPSGASVTLHEPLRKLRVIAADAEGLNDVKLPVVNDSTGSVKKVYEILRTRYNSRSFGIAEIEMYGEGGKKLPLKSIPYYEAAVIPLYVTLPLDRYFLFDGDPGTGAMFYEAKGLGKCLITFKDYAPVTRVKLVNSIHDFEAQPGVKTLTLNISGRKPEVINLKPDINVIDLKEPMVAKSYTLTMENFEGENNVGVLSEIYFYDGAKWYTITPDSSGERLKTLKDSTASTPIRFVLDNRVYYSNRFVEMIADTFKLANYENAPMDKMKQDVRKDYEALFRTNQTMEFVFHRTVTDYDKTVVSKTEDHVITGYWRMMMVSPKQVKVEIKGWKTVSVSIDGKPPIRRREQVRIEADFSENYLNMGEPYGKMLITY